MRDVLLGFIQKFQFSDFEESSWLIPRVVGRLSSSAERLGMQDDGAEKVPTSLEILKSGKPKRVLEVDTMVR